MSQQARVALFFSLFGALFGLGGILHFTSAGIAFAKLAPSLSSAARANDGVTWEDFSTSRFIARMRESRPVLVFFHADWDLASSISEHYLRSEPIQRLLAEHEFAVLDANSTKPSREFELFQKTLGFRANNVPRIVIYSRSGGRPTVTSGIQKSELAAAIEAAARWPAL